MRKFTYYGSYLSAPPFVGLFDTYGGANLGLSLRRLSASFSGDLVTVVRVSDLAEQSFGLVNNLVDVAGIESFLSGSEGRVSFWAEQSGNGNHAHQSVLSLMPIISFNGTVILDGGLPALYFHGSWMNLTNTINETTNTKIGIARRSPSGHSGIDVHFFGVGVPTGSNTSTLGVFGTLGFTYYLGNKKVFLNYSTPINLNRFLLWGSDDGISQEFRKDGGSIYVSPNSQLLINSIDKIGVYISDTIYLTQGAFFNEIIHYPTSKIADVTGIENNINNYYGIY